MSLENITDDTFEKEVLKADMPVVVDFYGTWCQPCKKLEPVYEEVSKQYSDKAKFVRFDIDNSKIPVTYKILSIPVIVVFNKGEETARRCGYADKDALKSFIEEAIGVKK